MTQILPFVMFGIGLDDAFIIAGAFDRTDQRKDCVERIHQTFEDVGVSVTLTSITSATAFGLGCISSIPAVYWLCFYAFPTILIDFIYQVTFFVALIAIDERRVRENRRDCCFWHTAATSLDEATPQVDTPPVEAARVEAALPPVEATTDDETRIWIEPKGHIADRFMVWYGKFLMQPWVKCLVLIGFAGLFSGFAYSASLLTQEFEFTDMVPDDSYLRDFYDILDVYSARSAVVPEVVFRFVDQSDPVIQDQMEEYVSDLVALDEVVDPPPSFWLEDFKIFTNTSMTSDLPFTQQIDLFLADPVYHEHNDDISRDVNGDIIASRCDIFMDNVDFNDVKQQIDALENQRAVTASQDINQDKKDWPFFTFAEM
jgi:Niemann-Pick C1 protein